MQKENNKELAKAQTQALILLPTGFIGEEERYIRKLIVLSHAVSEA